MKVKDDMNEKTEQKLCGDDCEECAEYALDEIFHGFDSWLKHYAKAIPGIDKEENKEMLLNAFYSGMLYAHSTVRESLLIKVKALIGIATKIK